MTEMPLGTCPRCGSDDVHHRAKRGDWVCFDCDQRWDGEPPSSIETPEPAPDISVAVFVSYGHADSFEFADRLRNDLRVRGVNPVWIDTEMIRCGDRWATSIEQGIRDSQTLLAVMSAHSLCTDSICQDEIAFAVSEGKRIVPLKIDADPALRPSLLLVRRSWVDFSSDYDSALERLIEALRGEDARLQPPLIALVTGIAPIDFSAEMARHAEGFYGREWLFGQIDDWISADTGRALVVVGAPGTGKSAIAARLSGRPDCAAVHFCSTSAARTLDPREFVASLVAQLVARIPEMADAVNARRPEILRERASEAFRELVVEPARLVTNPGETQLLVIDALDEASTVPGENIVDVVADNAHALPEWMRIIATTRPAAPVLSRLKGLGPVELDAERDENQRDVRGYLESRLALPLGSAWSSHALDVLTARSAGNFLYAKMAADALLNGSMAIEDVEDLPPGLDAFFATLFAKHYLAGETFSSQYAPILQLLVAAFAPLELSVISGALGEERSSVHLRLERLRPILKMASMGADCTYALFHRALPDWLADASRSGPFWCDPLAGDEAIANSLLTRPLDSEYGVRWLPEHLLRLGRYSDVANLLGHPAFLAAAWDADPYGVRRSWAEIERCSDERMVPTYGLDRADRKETSADGVVAELLALAGHPQEALSLWLTGAETARRGLRREDLRLALYQAATLLIDLGRYSDAMHMLREDEDLCRASGATLELGEVLNRQAKIRRRRGEYEEAMQLSAEAESLFRDLGMQDLVAGALRRQGLVARRTGDYCTAMERLRAAEALYESLGDLDGLSRTWGNIAVVLQRQGAFDEALKLHQKQEETCRLMGTPDGVQRSLGNQAVVMRATGKLDEALLLLAEQEAICRDTNAPYHLARCLGNQALCLADLGDVAEAERRSEEQRKICSELNDPYAAEEACGVRARVARAGGRDNEALELFREQESQCRALADRENLAACLSEMSQLLEGHGDLALARVTLAESIEISRELGSPELAARIGRLSALEDAPSSRGLADELLGAGEPDS